MESGRRWKDEDIPKTEWELARFLWQPEAEMYGIQRIEYLDDVLILSGSGVGGGSHVYANTLYVPPKQFFNAPEWAGITDWADEPGEDPHHTGIDFDHLRCVAGCGHEHRADDLGGAAAMYSRYW
jgi:hypothetical protein